MPILKTEILGSAFEINYEDGEKDKLEEIIKSFKLRLLEFENLYGKVSDIKLIFLAALNRSWGTPTKTYRKKRGENSP